MTIRNMEKFVESLPDWAILNGCWGMTTISPTDIDGCVERNGLCLYLEHKQLGAHIGKGQHGVFQTWAKQGSTVIVYWTGEGLEDVRQIRIYTRGDLNPKTWDADLGELRRAAHRWFQIADKP